MTTRAKAISVLAANTAAFTVCFAVWTMYGVLVTYLVDQQAYDFSKSQMGWLIGIPVLSGALFRLPAGMLTDRYGGRPIFAAIMLFAALSAFLVSFADGFWDLFFAGLGFGFAGASFAVGIAYTAVWFPENRQGTALGIFGAGNTGAAITALVAPGLLASLTSNGAELERWRVLPKLYALALVVTTALFWLTTFSRKPDDPAKRTVRQRLAPLKVVRVWRFGLYYFLTFGSFVALAQWLIPYYVNVYGLSVAAAGLLSSVFTLPSGGIRALGGWLSDRFGARAVMYWVLGGCTVGTLLLVVPRMDIRSPGEGVSAARAGTVTAVTEDAIEVDGVRYPLRRVDSGQPRTEGALIWPTTAVWQEPVVRSGERVEKRQLLARGVTRIYFQANMWVFTVLVLVVGVFMGVGNAAVYKHIPTYFPRDVGTVGGVVGVIGALGGFAGPILFGYLLAWTGIWTTNWMFLFAVSVICLIWMRAVVQRMLEERATEVAGQVEEPVRSAAVTLRVLCPVHGVEARVRMLVRAGNEAPILGACSLRPGEHGRPPCEGQCVVSVADPDLDH